MSNVKHFGTLYRLGLMTKERVRELTERGVLTADEYTQITGEAY